MAIFFYQKQKIKTAKIKISIFIKQLDFTITLMQITQSLLFFLSGALFISLVSADMSIDVL